VTQPSRGGGARTIEHAGHIAATLGRPAGLYVQGQRAASVRAGGFGV